MRTVSDTLIWSRDCWPGAVASELIRWIKPFPDGWLGNDGSFRAADRLGSCYARSEIMYS